MCMLGLWRNPIASWFSFIIFHSPFCEQFWISFYCYIFIIIHLFFCSASGQFSHSVLSDSLQPHEPQHARLLCPSPTPGVQQIPCPLSLRCHTTISSSAIPFSSCPQSLPASGSLPMNNTSCEVAKVLEFQLQHQSFQWTPRTDLL